MCAIGMHEPCVGVLYMRIHTRVARVCVGVLCICVNTLASLVCVGVLYMRKHTRFARVSLRVECRMHSESHPK